MPRSLFYTNHTTPSGLRVWNHQQLQQLSQVISATLWHGQDRGTSPPINRKTSVHVWCDFPQIIHGCHFALGIWRSRITKINALHEESTPTERYNVILASRKKCHINLWFVNCPHVNKSPKEGALFLLCLASNMAIIVYLMFPKSIQAVGGIYTCLRSFFSAKIRPKLVLWHM